MHIIDLSHALEPDMPLYPGTAAPRFTETAAIETDGYREKRISLGVHTGTHVDAPAHLIRGRNPWTGYRWKPIAIRTFPCSRKSAG